MLHQHNLDDLRFNEILHNARMSIDKYFPAWNDLNTHDPGVTLIELFAWLTELQRFHMDQTETAEPLFPLLGIKRRRAQAAVAEVLIEPGADPCFIPAGTPLYAEEVRFETVRDTVYNGEAAAVTVIQRETVHTPFVLGYADGCPGAQFTADTRGQIVYSFALTAEGHVWTRTDGFQASLPGDKHYTLDFETGEVTFGDGLHGAIPRGEIVVTELSLTRGRNGNIAPDRIKTLAGLPVSQPYGAEGGTTRESAKYAVLRTFESRRQAVSAEDIEQLILETPGLDVQCVHVFSAAPDIRIGKPRLITAAVKLARGVLTQDVKQRICNQLEPYRLVCREFIITAPKTVQIRLNLTVRVNPHGAGFKAKLEQSVRTYFENNYSGFGAVIRVSDFNAFVTDIHEVLEVTHCTFRAYGDAKTSPDGDITPAQDALAELAGISIRFFTRET